MPRSASVLTDEVKTALIECDGPTLTRGLAIASSLSKQLPDSVGEDAIAAAVRKTLVRAGLPAVGNEFVYAKETALNMAGEDMERRLESQEGNERRPPRGHVRAEGFLSLAPTVDERAGRDPEADAFLAEMEQALSRQPLYRIVRVPGNPPVFESAKDRILEAVSLLYRSRGQGAAQFFKDPDSAKTYAVCIRRADAEWTRQRLWDWFGFVRAHVEAKRSGASFVPEIPNAYRFLVERLMDYRKTYGGEEADPRAVVPFAV
jgi:hypothetical protein